MNDVLLPANAAIIIGGVIVIWVRRQSMPPPQKNFFFAESEIIMLGQVAEHNQLCAVIFKLCEVISNLPD